MKYCTNCGHKLEDAAKFCPQCGTPQSAEYQTKEHVEGTVVGSSNDDEHETLRTLAKIFTIIGAVVQGICIIPLLWVLPITLPLMRAYEENRKPSLAICILDLLFVSFVGGLFALVDHETK